MIAFVIYLLLLLWLIAKGYPALFRDRHIKPREFAFFFLFKALAVPVFYLVYHHVYGGIGGFDTGKFYNDARIINTCGRADPGFYIRLLLGLQDDAPGSPDYENCLVQTLNWDNGVIKDYLYNDNRVVIRVHSLVHFIAFDSYFVHALFSCFCSFVGITLLYKTFQEFYAGKEKWTLVVMCFLPALWFYTGALMKEGLALLLLGGLAWHLKMFITTRFVRHLAWLLPLCGLSLLLKPYLLLVSLFSLTCLFVLLQSTVRYRVLIYLSALFLGLVAANGLSLVVKQRSLFEAAVGHQLRFADAARGGIFLTDQSRFLRLKYDTSLIRRVPGDTGSYTVAKGASYLYWNLPDLTDTLQCIRNTDTTTRYTIAYTIAESKSNILVAYPSHPAGFVAYCLYYAMLHPFFFNAGGLLQLVASFENLLIVLALLIILTGWTRGTRDPLLTVAFVCPAMLLCILIGFSTPNSGAIFRYRAPEVIFILLAALYYFPLKRPPRASY